MAKQLTERQRLVLDTVINYTSEHGYPPSIRELCRLLDISSLRGVTIHLDAIERKGWIHRQRTSRSIQVLAPLPGAAPPTYVPLVGTIAAGTPLLAVENIECYVPAPPEMGAAGDELFALRVRGDSMIGDHVLDGDVIVVRSQPSADSGELVAALIGDEATVKRLDLDSTPPRLMPSNPNYEPIDVRSDEVRVLGKVVGLVRDYAASQTRPV